MVYVSEIFNEVPKQWGLRGDPFFWEYLKNHFITVRLPYSKEMLRMYIIKEFRQLTGYYPEEGKIFFVTSFARDYKGMSTGSLCCDFWLQQAIPLLIERIERANGSLEG